MKNFIVLAAVLVLLMTFPIQYALNIKNHQTISITQKYTNNAKEKARQIGYFSENIINELINNLITDAGLERDDIIVEATDLSHRKKRGDMLHYKVTIRLACLIAAQDIWGIDNSENFGIYTIENDAPSEWLMP